MYLQVDLSFVALQSSSNNINCFFSLLISRKAEEYLRLSQVKCATLLVQMSATSSAVICLDLAAGFMKHPMDKVGFCPKMVSHSP